MEVFTIEIKINKEIRNFKESIFFGLSLRQFVCAVLAVGASVGLYFLLGNLLGSSEVGWICVVGAAPFALLGFFKFQGLPLERVKLAMELFATGSLNIFAHQTNVDIANRVTVYDIRDLGKQLKTIGMLVVLDAIFNRLLRNRARGRRTWIIVDELYLLFSNEYSANYLFELWKRIRKYGGYACGITQNVGDMLQSHTARAMLANSEFLVMLNQSGTDRLELAKLLNISDTQLSYVTNVPAGHGLIKCGASIVPFENNLPVGTELYRLCSTRPGESL
jgi:hypothetical protein